MRKLFTIDLKDYNPNGKKVTRPSVRGIILDDKNNIAMIYSQKYHFYKFPGGGIEGDETHLETLKREIKEETGMTLIPDTVKEFGEVLRIQKFDEDNEDVIFIQENFYYNCQVEQEIVEQNLDDKEKESDFILKFVPIDEAIRANAAFKGDSLMKKQMAERERRVLEIVKETLVQPKDLANWKKIAEIADKDFGFNTPKEKNDKIRFSVRIILKNNRGEICVIKSEKYGYMQVPGGGIDPGESILEALRRETKEETGFLIDDISPLGYVLEKREDVRNEHDWGRTVSYVFTASIDKEVGTDYTEAEQNEKFRPTWIKLEDFINEQEKNEGNIISYSGSFSNRRDLEIARFYQKLES